MHISLGGPDHASIRFLRQWPRGFYISPLVDNFDGELQRFLTEQYFKNGAALFGRQTACEMQKVRDWARGYLDDSTDEAVYEIVQYFVQRVRNYAHLESLAAAGIEEAWVDHGGCGHPRRLRVSIAGGIMRLRLFKNLSLLEYEELVWARDHGFPPFDLKCRCRMEGVI